MLTDDDFNVALIDHRLSDEIVPGGTERSTEASVRLRTDRAETQQRIAALEAQVAEAEEFEAGALPVVNDIAAYQGRWDAAQQRIAALEADDAVWCKHSLVQLVEERDGLREQVAAANLRAEGLAGALDSCQRIANGIGQRCWEELRDVVDAALAAEPDARPLAQVAEALVAVLDIEPQLVGRVTYNKAATALALLAELGVGDA